MNQQSQPDLQKHLITFRDKIDSLDRRLTETLAERMKVCHQVAVVKSQHGIPMMQSDRVSRVLAAARDRAKDNGLSEEYVATIFEIIIDETCRQETDIMSEIEGD